MQTDHGISMQKVLQAIEDELESITIEEIISISGYSYYHFHRIFKAYTGESLKKYIKRLQLEKTLHQLNLNKDNITNVAIKAGYHMSSSFNKAFKEMFGLNPSEYKKSLYQQRIKYKKINPVRTDTIPDMDVYSIRHRGDYDDSDGAIEVLMNFSKDNNLFSKDFAIYAIAHDNPDITNIDKRRLDICISKTKEVNVISVEEIQSKTLKGGRYAVFLHKGSPAKLVDTYGSIFGNWLFTSDIVLRDEPIIQKFLNNKREVSETELLIEVYVPIEL